MHPAMSSSLSSSEEATPRADFAYRHVAIAVDNSVPSNRGVTIGLELAGMFGAQVTATHAYAARLHDLRFRQMEGGLPEKYRKEEELERQRDVHDSLITRGLELISDSYLDVVEDRARAAGLSIARKALEGKNYSALLDDIAASDYDLIVLGASGLGAVNRSVIGSVCERVVRHVDRDVLVIKETERDLRGGLMLVAVDGSARSYGGLMTALRLARELGAKVEVVSAFDPYFHYVAFDSIAGVLSDEAGQVFKFKEQEQLHEEIIDSGLAKIYQAHLTVAQKLAADEGLEVTTTLLAGKPLEVIANHIDQREPSLVILGKTGCHADERLQIGSTTENLLRLAPCNLLISCRELTPRVEQIAEETTSWTEEAEARMERVPSFVRNMARGAILRHALERGHTVVSSKIVDEAIGDLLPASAMEAMGLVAQAAEKRARARQREAPESGDRTFDGRAVCWDDDATSALESVGDETARRNVKLRVEKLAHSRETATISAAMVREITGPAAKSPDMPWEEDALARLERVPEGFMRDRTRERIESNARSSGAAAVTLAVCEEGFSVARQAMMSMSGVTGDGGGHPTSGRRPDGTPDAPPHDMSPLPWTDDADERLGAVPEGFMRNLTRQRVEAFVRQRGAAEVTRELVEEKLAQWTEGSAKHRMEMQWQQEPLERVMRIPEVVRGMVIQEVERCAEKLGQTTVTNEVMEQATGAWRQQGHFHSDSAPDQYNGD